VFYCLCECFFSVFFFFVRKFKKKKLCKIYIL
jgi:hypothetical protein